MRFNLSNGIIRMPRTGDSFIRTPPNSVTDWKIDMDSTTERLRVTLSGLSPVAISWQKLDDGAGACLPNTGDGSMNIWYMSMLLTALAGIGMITRK